MITSAAAAAASAKKPKPDAGSKVKGRRKAEKAAAAAALMEAEQHVPSVEGTAGGAGGDAAEVELAAEEGLLPEDSRVVGGRMPPPSYLSKLIGKMGLQGGPAEGAAAAAAQVCEEEGQSGYRIGLVCVCLPCQMPPIIENLTLSGVLVLCHCGNLNRETSTTSSTPLMKMTMTPPGSPPWTRTSCHRGCGWGPAMPRGRPQRMIPWMWMMTTRMKRMMSQRTWRMLSWQTIHEITLGSHKRFKTCNRVCNCQSLSILIYTLL